MTPLEEAKQIIRVLIFEDEPLIALSMEEALIEAGFRITGVAGKLEKVLALIASNACDAAIVDANLGGVSASPRHSHCQPLAYLLSYCPAIRENRRGGSVRTLSSFKNLARLTWL